MPGRPRSILLALRGAVACRFQTSLPFIFCLLPPRGQSTESYYCRFVRSQDLRFGLSRGGASASLVVSTLTLTDGSCAMGGRTRPPRPEAAPGPLNDAGGGAAWLLLGRRRANVRPPQAGLQAAWARSGGAAGAMELGRVPAKPRLAAWAAH